ncbi:PREDICTED: ankyrin repeat domain-containing protein SOWAHD [Crocodylus porosus]|uniref:ankyrin repeat domain-containing protein SOWAHD n=1 Tax=Crocodylus porosus TaxID=8502 RepID=UPI00093BFAA6|nr:PREDICTED: ankyrin repeat domain-containing protein SOWAHD [Crocodylus porosus]
MAGCEGEGSLKELKIPVAAEPHVLQEASQPRAEAAIHSPMPSSKLQMVTPGNVSFRRLPMMDPSRSLSKGSWGRSFGSTRISIGPGSYRRRGLKEVLLQSNGAEGAMWLAAAQKIASGSSLSLGVQPEKEPPPEQSPEELALALDPLEHEWVLTVAQGESESILRLLDMDGSLLSRRDFVTGFTALHWLAKHGRHEDLIKVISHAQTKGYPVDVNIPAASGGLTPLHLACLQGHEMVIKVLVGAYGADTRRRDHSGHQAWKYLKADSSQELKELAGALEEDLAQLGACNTNNNCRPSREGCAGAGDCVDSAAGAGGLLSRQLSSFRRLVRQAFAFFQDR